MLGVLVELPFRRGHVYCLPILFRPSSNTKSAAKHRRAYRTRPELAVELLQLLCGLRKDQRFQVVADSTYGGQSVLCHLPTNCDLTSRLLKDARLYAAAPVRKPGTNGRPRQRGERLPTPRAMLTGRCRRVTLDIYGRREQARVADKSAMSMPRRIDHCEWLRWKPSTAVVDRKRSTRPAPTRPPSVALSKPPIPSPARSAMCSVAVPNHPARGMIAAAESRKMSVCESGYAYSV